VRAILPLNLFVADLALAWRTFADAGENMIEQDAKTIVDGPFLNTREAAVYLKLKPNTLEKMRVYGGGPVFRKHGRHVVYHIDDLTAWSDLRKKDSTGNV
jgi:hypothetical protein